VSVDHDCREEMLEQALVEYVELFGMRDSARKLLVERYRQERDLSAANFGEEGSDEHTLDDRKTKIRSR